MFLHFKGGVLVVICLIFLLFSAVLHASVFDQLDRQIEEALQDYQIPGLAVGIVREDQLIYAKAIGMRDWEQSLPVTTDTLFPIGSCTKAFTTYSFGSLVEEQRIGWDQRVVEVLPSFRLPDHTTTDRVTFRDLCSNQSGMPRHDFFWYNATLTRQEFLERLPHLEPVCGLRKCFEYNNLMFLVTGMAMEKVTGKSWAEIVSDKILTPLKMVRTNWSLDELQKSDNFAVPYTQKGAAICRMPFRDISFVRPAGGLNSSVKEMSYWLKFLLRGGAAIEQLYKPQIYFAADPKDPSRDRVGGYGLGWYVQDHRGYEYVSHDGGVDGFTSIVALLPKQKIGVVVLCNKNLSPFPRFLALHLFDLLLGLSPTDQVKGGAKGVQTYQNGISEQKEREEAQRKMAPPSHTFEDYVGDYTHPGYGRARITLVDRSLHLIYNDITFHTEPWHYDVFRICGESQDLHMSFIGKKIAFRGNIDGEIDELLVPFEARTAPILFKREKRQEAHSHSYQQQFTGTYEIYNYIITITVREGVLIANIPGQPTCELIPNGVNEFAIKSYPGYSMNFVMNEDGTVREVLLRQPYGIVFTAKPLFIGS